MSFFRKLIDLLVGGNRSADDAGANAFWLYVRCNACGETIRIRVSREHDLSAEYEEGSDAPTGYRLRKEIVGQQCFRRIEVDMTFDYQRRVTERQIRGGTFITREEYEAGAAPPADQSAPAGPQS
ncbi:MAG TPA: hypothetical protein VHS99_26350 [Chloroflexota bacterium]|nr:hypothetical protein [Chloroflexota bacterium]